MRKIVLFLYIILISNLAISINIPNTPKKNETSENIISNFVLTDPIDGKKLELNTSCKIWHDKKYIFLHWEAEIDDTFRKGNFTSRERTPEADYLSIEIITKPDSYYSYGFYFYPYENEIDYIRDKNMYESITWDSNYHYKSVISKNLWIVDAKIPFTSLRFETEPPYNWKIVLNRYLKLKEETYSAPNNSPNMGSSYYKNGRDITITSKIPHNLNLYIRPYYIYNKNLKNDSSNSDEFGLDFSLDPSSSTKLNFTYNPDFTDVPLDNVTNIYNLKYPPSFPENRYFFVEDINAFNATKELFYSRNISQPIYALKYDGDYDNFSFGILSSKDNYSSDKDDIYNIFAIKPKTEKMSLEITALSLINSDYHNEVLHLKPYWEFSKNQSIWFESNISNENLTEKNQIGSYNKFGYNFSSAKTDLSFFYDRISEDYSAEMGKIDDTNYSNFCLELTKNENINRSIFRRFITTFSLNKQSDLENKRDEMKFLSSSSTITTDLNIALNIDIIAKDELYNYKYYDQYLFAFGLAWYNYKWFRPDIRFNKLKALDYYLEETYPGYWTQAAITSDINKFTTCRITSDHIHYIDYPQNLWFDDDYWIINFDADIAFSTNYSISSGIRFDNYNEADLLSIYSNFQWRFKDLLEIVVGYKSTPNLSEIDGENNKSIFIKSTFQF